MTSVRIATRGSELALWQARYVGQRLGEALGVEAKLVVLKTAGDRLHDVSLAKVGGKGLFVKEIEEALLDDRADLAVHSAKDLPAETPEGLFFVAHPERADPRDALVARERGARLDDLPKGARVGTGSARRTAQLRRRRPDLEVVALRGNVPTRLRKLEDAHLDAVILACAGLDRLGLAERIDERIAPDVVLPAVAQGALAIQARVGDPLGEAAAILDHRESAVRVRAERAFQARLGGDCHVPVAGFAELQTTGRLRVRGMVLSSDGTRVASESTETDASSAEAAGRWVAETVLGSGGTEILAAARAETAG